MRRFRDACARPRPQGRRGCGNPRWRWPAGTPCWGSSSTSAARSPGAGPPRAGRPAAAGGLTRAVQAVPASGLGGPPWTHDDRGGALPAVEDAWWHAGGGRRPAGRPTAPWRGPGSSGTSCWACSLTRPSSPRRYPISTATWPAGCWIPRPRPCARTGTPGWPPPRSPIPPHRAAAAGRGRRHRSVGRRADPAARPAGPPRRWPAAAARRRHRRGAGRGHLAPGRGRAAPPRPRPPRGTARARPAARHWLPGHGAQPETVVSLMIPAKVAGTVSAAAAAGP